MTAFAIYIILVTLFDIGAEISAKYYSLQKHPGFLVLTVILFGAAGFFFAKSLKYEGVAIANIIWIALTVILVTLIGFFFFKEQITTMQFVGIGVILIGLVLINLR